MGTAIKLRAAQRVGEKPDIDRHWRGLFLDTLAETSNVSEAARKSGASTSRAYKTRRLDAEFREQWNAALLEGYEHLEMETLHRLRMGTGQDGNKFDIPNALRLLTLHRESAARQKAMRGEEDEESVLESLNAKIDLMRQREAEMKQILIEEQEQMEAALHNEGD